MQLKLTLLLAIVIMASASFGQEVNSGSMAHHKSLLNRNNMDTTVRPGDDFYRYANGNLLKNNPVHNFGTTRSSFSELQGNNNKKLHDLLDSVAAINNAPPGSSIQKLGDLYRSGMDTDAIEKAGNGPLKDRLDRIDSIKDVDGLLAEIALEHTEGLGTVFTFNVYPDEHNVGKEMCYFVPGGLGMPRECYHDEDSRPAKIREAYKAYVRQILSLIGDKNVKDDAWYICDLECALLAASRDPQHVGYRKFDIEDINKLTPGIDWKILLHGLNVPDQDSVVVDVPGFFTDVAHYLKEKRLTTWKRYLQYNLVSHMAPYLSRAFDSCSFSFYHRALQGQQEQGPRWEKVMAAIDHSEGDLLGQMYVARYVKPGTKERMEQLVDNLQQVYADRISKMHWLSDTTKQKALVKLRAITKKIGYPDEWTDYSTLTIVNKSYAKNIMIAEQWAFQNEMNKLTKPVNRAMWRVEPQTVNAFYYALLNEIVFPAGILQRPFFDENADDAVIYGSIGALKGHEITHGFDNNGRQYDAQGNRNYWWTPEDKANFAQRANRVVEIYSKVPVVDNYHVNGELTEGENLADLGGLNIAYDAFKKTKQGQSDEQIDGFTPDQRFFLSYARMWRANTSPEETILNIKTNPHSPTDVRVNVPVSNMEAWYKAFNIQPTDSLFRPADLRVRVW